MESKEKYKDILDEKFECICENCSKPFIGIDEDATLCPECWDAVLDQLLEENGILGID